MLVKHREGFQRLAIALCLSALLGACGPKVEDGIAAYRSGDFTKALAVFRRAPEDPAALYYMHLMTESGSGVEKDWKAALDYLRRAADAGYPPAMRDRGKTLIAGINEERSVGVAYLAAAVKAGDAEANAYLGKYHIELGLADKGLEMMHRAESTRQGKIALALLYRDGAKGVKVKPDAALRYMEELAAEPDYHSRGYFAIESAEFYYYGYGTPRDLRRAAAILEPVIEDDRDARGMYGWLLFHGEGVPADPNRAVKLWGDPSPKDSDFYGYAAKGLALAYATGMGVKKDPAKARGLLERHHIHLSGALWRMYLTATGVTGRDCDWGDSIYPAVEGTRYVSLGAKAYLAHGECLLAVAAREKNPNARYVALHSADSALARAESLGAGGASAVRERAKVARADGGVFIGMTAAQVLASKWGKPSEIHRTQTTDSVSEQWVYGGRNYLYFRNGVLEAIQN